MAEAREPRSAPASDPAPDDAGRRAAVTLGYAGLIPFVAAAGLSWYPPLSAVASAALLAYAAVILAFLGAVHWGVALHAGRGRSSGRYAWSVLPALTAWPLLLAPPRYGLPLMALAVFAWWLVERRLIANLLPGWYLHLRDPLSLVAIFSLIAGWLAASP